MNVAELDTLKTLEHEAGRPVGPSDAGTDEPGRRRWINWKVLGFGVRVTGEDRADAEHAVRRERNLKHLPVSGLKNVEREKAVGEEAAILENHDGDSPGQFDGGGWIGKELGRIHRWRG
jgi:hypothetical protein